MKQALIAVVIVLTVIYVTGWTFNHVNAWAGIGIGLFGSYFLADQLLKKTTKK